MPLTSQLHAHLHNPVAVGRWYHLEAGRRSHRPARSQVALTSQVTGRNLLSGRKVAQQAGRRRVRKPKGQVLFYKTPSGEM